MALYEYHCQECDHQFETLQRMSDSPLTTCPKCGQESLKKLVATNTGFCLMGGGWTRPGLRAPNRHN